MATHYKHKYIRINNLDYGHEHNPGNGSGNGSGNGNIKLKPDTETQYLLKTKNIIIDLYQYYFYNGFHVIIIEKITQLLISYFMLFITNFLINCIDYKGLESSNGGDSIYQYINMSNWFSLHPYMIIYTVLYSLYLISITIKFIGLISKFRKIRKLYNIYLKINDYRLKFISWDEIVSIILERLAIFKHNLANSKIEQLPDTTTNHEINIYTINNKICTQSNIIIAMIRGGFIKLGKISKFLEWNYIYCIIEPMILCNSGMQRISNTGIDNSAKNNGIHNRIHDRIHNRYDITETNLDDTLNNNGHIGLSAISGIDILDNKEIYKQYTTPLLNIYDNTYGNSNGYGNGNGNGNGIGNGIGNSNDINLNKLNQTEDQGKDQSEYEGGDKGEDEGGDKGEYRIDIPNNSPVTGLDCNGNNLFDTVLYNTFINSENVQNMQNMQNEVLNYNYDRNDRNARNREYLRLVDYRIKLVMVINIITLPFIILIFMIYLTIKYGERMYNNPSVLFQRKIDIKTLWKMRYYNELPNLFKQRIQRIEANMDKIINSYTSPLNQIIIRFILFTIGGIFIFLLLLSFIFNENFSQLEIIQGHNIIWFLGLSGTFILILNKFINLDNLDSKQVKILTKLERITAFDELRNDLVAIDPQIAHIEDREYLVNLIKNIYHYRITYIFYELLYIILAPYYIWKWRYDVSNNHLDILGLIENHYLLGNVCKYSIMTNGGEMANNPHMLLSIKEFSINHDWHLPAIYS